MMWIDVNIFSYSHTLNRLFCGVEWTHFNGKVGIGYCCGRRMSCTLRELKSEYIDKTRLQQIPNCHDSGSVWFLYHSSPACLSTYNNMELRNFRSPDFLLVLCNGFGLIWTNALIVRFYHEMEIIAKNYERNVTYQQHWPWFSKQPSCAIFAASATFTSSMTINGLLPEIHNWKRHPQQQSKRMEINNRMMEVKWVFEARGNGTPTSASGSTRHK